MSALPKIPASQARYADRFARVLDYIESHADGAASLDALSDVAAFSRWHFQRQFSAYLGMSVHRYVQFMRLRRAAWRLAFRADTSIIDVALATGYESTEAFARAFRQSSGQSPSDFRARPDWAELQSRFTPFTELRKTKMQVATPTVRVVNFPATRLVTLEHRGSPVRIGDSIRRFIEWRKANSLPPRTHATYNIVYNDPDETPADDFRLGLGVATGKPIPHADPDMKELVLPACRCELLQHRGSDDLLARSIHHLYAAWLPSSGEEPRDFPLFLQRVQFFPDVPESDSVTDIYLPLK
jgi:AraC family transcriptional regulator